MCIENSTKLWDLTDPVSQGKQFQGSVMCVSFLEIIISIADT